ncbi:hypothetical protein BC830DRAFT_649425 [Chytriomyces sp. MP71]|nr:hypothetical protein BC830DRAFT_649425 [Chytriomyces sp. MP71]
MPKGWWSHTAHTILTPLVGQVLSNGTSTDTAILFKDKLNFKPPGGGGFACHQDVTAYKPEDLVDYHITALVAIDASTRLKGPFEVARGWSGRREILPHAYGAVHKEAEDALEFEEVCVEAGEVVLFDSWIPHRAGRNGSADSRRAAFLTYNCKSAGNFHARYYAMKAELMMKGSMSLNLDFNGTLVVE